MNVHKEHTTVQAFQIALTPSDHLFASVETAYDFSTVFVLVSKTDCSGKL